MLSAAPSRTCRCQSSGCVMVSSCVMPVFSLVLKRGLFLVLWSAGLACDQGEGRAPHTYQKSSPALPLAHRLRHASVRFGKILSDMRLKASQAQAKVNNEECSATKKEHYKKRTLPTPTWCAHGVRRLTISDKHEAAAAPHVRTICLRREVP